ncbi:MAG: WD40/YVTN/BNR-like repeat-containing protein [Deltaproteobacteria bacterium]
MILTLWPLIKKAPRRLYSAAGDGYFESFDYGESWNSPTAGLKHHYLYGLAVDSANPQTVIVSASLTAQQAHYIENANSLVYRKSNDGENWNAVSKGLPESKGTIITILASNPINSGEFFAINNRGVFISTDSGVSWTALDIPWPKEYLSQHSWALTIGK